MHATRATAQCKYMEYLDAINEALRPTTKDALMKDSKENPVPYTSLTTNQIRRHQDHLFALRIVYLARCQELKAGTLYTHLTTTCAKVAEYFGVTGRTVQNWVRDFKFESTKEKPGHEYEGYMSQGISTYEGEPALPPFNPLSMEDVARRLPDYINVRSMKCFFVSIFFTQKLASGQELGELIRVGVSDFIVISIFEFMDGIF